jgi:tellurite resistance protein TerC
MTVHSPTVWLGFTGLMLVLLIVDLGILGRRETPLTTRGAFLWFGTLVALALAFAGFLWWREDASHALEFTTGYVVEMALSVDNLFVFLFLFRFFAVPASAQPVVLKWGILGAMVLRGVMIGLGAALMARFEWIIWVFGGILVITGVRMFRDSDDQMEPEQNPVVRLARRILPFSACYEESRFTAARAPGKPRLFTPLMLVLIIVEWSDLVFAIDSIPAVFAVTRDPFLVYSSNVFAILGLRALYFILSGALDTFRFLKPGVALILVFVGGKMLVEHWWEIPTAASLAIIVGALVVAIGASVLLPKPPVPQDEGAG